MTTGNTPLDTNQLTVEQAVRVLSAAGSRRVNVDLLRRDIEAGSPTNPDESDAQRGGQTWHRLPELRLPAFLHDTHGTAAGWTDTTPKGMSILRS